MKPDITYFMEVTGGDKNVMLEFLQIFKEQILEFINELNSAIQQGDFKKVAAVAHKAKSTVAVFGMKDWEFKLKEIQVKINEGIVPDNLNLLILQFEKDAYETYQFFEKFISNES